MNWLEALLLGCTPYRGDDWKQVLCRAKDPSGEWWECSLAKGHDGPHLAGTSGSLCTYANGELCAWE